MKGIVNTVERFRVVNEGGLLDNCGLFIDE